MSTRRGEVAPGDANTDLRSQHTGWRARLSYRLDIWLARGALPAIVGLTLMAFALVVVTALVLVLAGFAEGSQSGLAEGVWLATTRALDPGTMAEDIGWKFRAISLIATCSGIFIISALIGLIVNGIDRRITDFRRGRTPVVESGHVLILGWSPKVPSIIVEQINAAAHARTKLVVAVLAPVDKLDMEQAVLREVTVPHRVRLAFRNGTPSSPKDLALMNPEQARSIIVLSPAGDPSPDAQVVRACFALLRSPTTPRPIVAEIASSALAKSLADTSRGDVIPVVSNEVIANVAAQVMRFPRLSVVYGELLDFTGDEFYVAPVKGLVGKTYGEAVMSFSQAAVIGLRRSTKRDPHVVLCPDPMEIIRSDDEIIAVAKDSESLQADVKPTRTITAHRYADEKGHKSRERLLIIGWSSVAPTLLRTFNFYLTENSIAFVAAVPELAGNLDDNNLDSLNNLSIKFLPHREGEFADIESLLSAEPFDRVVVLSYRHAISSAEADARTLLTLVRLRRLLDASGINRGTPVLAELQNAADIDLVAGTGTEDFIVSDRLAGQMLSQLSVSPGLSDVFDELFEPRGADILMRPIGDYLIPGRPSTFGELTSSALEQGEAAIGYVASSRGAMNVVLNPKKGEAVTFAENDSAVVVVTR